MSATTERIAIYSALFLFNIAIFFISLNSFATASMILYGNLYTLSVATTLVTAFISFAGALTYEYWVKPAGNVMAKVLEASGNNDMAEIVGQFTNQADFSDINEDEIAELEKVIRS